MIERTPRDRQVGVSRSRQSLIISPSHNAPCTCFWCVSSIAAASAPSASRIRMCARALKLVPFLVLVLHLELMRRRRVCLGLQLHPFCLLFQFAQFLASFDGHLHARTHAHTHTRTISSEFELTDSFPDLFMYVNHRYSVNIFFYLLHGK